MTIFSGFSKIGKAAVEVLPSNKLVGGWLDDTVTGVLLGVKITVFVAEFVGIFFLYFTN